MNLFNRSILPFFIAFTFLGLFLVGCLDAPDYPKDIRPVESIIVMVKQSHNDYSTTLKVNPSDTATITASITPKKIEDEMTYEWFYETDGQKELLKRGQQYSFYPTRSDKNIPNKLIVTDGDDNKLVFDFTIIINTAPVLSDSTIPADGDTLYGTKESAFLFEWYSFDMDYSNGDTLFHTLEIDGKPYEVGTLQQVKQSGFKPGEHIFRIIVTDLYNDSDTLAYKKFYVVDTLEAK